MPASGRTSKRLVRIPSVSAEGSTRRRSARSAERQRGAPRALPGCETRLLEIDGAHPAVLGRIAGARRRPDGPALRAPRRPADRPDRAVGVASVRADRARRPPLRPRRRPTTRRASLAPCRGDARVGRAAAGRRDRRSSRARRRSGSEHLAEFLDRLRATSSGRRRDPGRLVATGGWGSRRSPPRSAGSSTASSRSGRWTTRCTAAMYGGPVPDAITALCADAGHAARRRRERRRPRPGRPDPPTRSTSPRRSSGADAGRPPRRRAARRGLAHRAPVDPAGHLGPRHRRAARSQEATNQLVPSARAKVSMRLAPGQDPAPGQDALVEAPGGQRPVGRRGGGPPGSGGPRTPSTVEARRSTPSGGPSRRPGACDPVDIGAGGSIPFVAAFAERSRTPPSCSPASRTRQAQRPLGEREPRTSGTSRRSCLAEALFLGYLAEW